VLQVLETQLIIFLLLAILRHSCLFSSHKKERIHLFPVTMAARHFTLYGCNNTLAQLSTSESSVL
jgi:hypothetical protein